MLDDYIKIKFCAKVYNGDSLNEQLKKRYQDVEANCRPYISSKDINATFSTIDYQSGLAIPFDTTRYKVAPHQSCLMCIEGGSAGRKVAFTSQDVCFVNKLACFKLEQCYEQKWMFYLLKTSLFQIQFNKALTGLIGGVAVSDIKNMVVRLPRLNEQTAIAKFLDRKTAQIDKAITIKEQQIALLKERKQIIVQNAVTHGLNPDAPMRDSGVEWIGEVPAHWEVLANRALFSERIEPGRVGLPLLSVSIHTGVSTEELHEDDNIRGRIKIEDKSKYSRVYAGDIAFNMMRAWQGAIGAVVIDGMVSPAYIVAKHNDQIRPKYFEYQYRSPIFIQQMDRFSKGITDFRKRLYWHEFKQLITIVPPVKEQHAIIDFIEDECSKIEKVVGVQEQQITKLLEYKATLINSAVTGKINVPGIDDLKEAV